MKSIYEYITETNINDISLGEHEAKRIEDNTKWLINHMGLDEGDDLDILGFWTSGKVVPAGEEYFANRVPVLHVAMFYKSYNHNIDDPEQFTDMIRWESEDMKRDIMINNKIYVAIDAVKVKGEQEIRKYKQQTLKKAQ